jgi:hypothetical protein
MKILQKIWASIKSLWNKKDAVIQKYAHISINVVEGLKKVMDSPVDDVVLSIVKSAIPGTADDVLIDKVKTAIEKYLPTALLNLKMIDSIAGITDPTEQLKAIIVQFKLSDDELKNKGYHDFSVLILNSLADGKLSWGECVVIAENYYQTFILPKENGTSQG